MQLVLYTDYIYHRDGSGVSAERAFALFVGEVSKHVEKLTVVGRLDPTPGRSRYPLPADVEFVPLPHYDSLADVGAVVASLPRAMATFWRVLGANDCAWLLGPHPPAVVFALLALARGRRVTLGVRQDFPAAVRHRYQARWMHTAANVLEAIWKLLARRCPVVVVGPELARQYRSACSVLPIIVSLVSADQIAPDGAPGASRNGEIRVLHAGRLDPEKNPLLLPDVLQKLRQDGRNWRLTVCGEGLLSGELAARLEQLGIAEHAELLGYVPLDGGLLDRFRSSHAFLHVSYTDGIPQVLIEANAVGLPLVATAVGGVPDLFGETALLVPPGDADAAATAVRRIIDDTGLRERLVASGLRYVREHTLENEAKAVVRFLAGEGPAA